MKADVIEMLLVVIQPRAGTGGPVFFTQNWTKLYDEENTNRRLCRRSHNAGICRGILLFRTEWHTDADGHPCFYDMWRCSRTNNLKG